MPFSILKNIKFADIDDHHKVKSPQIKTKSAKLPGFDPVGGAGDLTGDGPQSVHLHDHPEDQTLNRTIILYFRKLPWGSTIFETILS